MSTNERFDESISSWLEQTAPGQIPQRVLEATFEQTRRVRQQNGWRAGRGRLHVARSVAALGGAAAVVTVATALALGSFGDRPAVGGPSPSDGQVVTSPSPASTTSPSEAQITALLSGFLEARVAGAGAQPYLNVPEADIPLLYATTSGARFERAEFLALGGIVWPDGWSGFTVRLFAGATTVTQWFAVVREEDGRLGLVGLLPDGVTPGEPWTTEDGPVVPLPYSLLDGEVTFAAAKPWDETVLERTTTILGGVGRGSSSQFTMFAVMADPLTSEKQGCEAGPGPVPADAEALAQSIRSNPDLEVTAPVAVSVGGIDALRMDVVAPGRVEAGECVATVLDQLGLSPYELMRLYLLDLPEGMSARILAIAIVALDSEFELVVEAAGALLDSFEFNPR